MVIAHHLIITAYGFWLPNDPRGSWSEWIRKWELLRFGAATKVDTRRSVAGVRHDRKLRITAKESLSFPPVHFTGQQALAIAQGFQQAIDEAHYRCLACAILPEHVHLVVARHERKAELMMRHLKARASTKLREAGLHPLERFGKDGELPSPWARRGWKVFLDDAADVLRAIAYVENNPGKEGKRRQEWPFVLPYEA
jgi:REP element-mobilizing transposase RayT